MTRFTCSQTFFFINLYVWPFSHNPLCMAFFFTFLFFHYLMYDLFFIILYVWPFFFTLYVWPFFPLPYMYDLFHYPTCDLFVITLWMPCFLDIICMTFLSLTYIWPFFITLHVWPFSLNYMCDFFSLPCMFDLFHYLICMTFFHYPICIWLNLLSILYVTRIIIDTIFLSFQVHVKPLASLSSSAPKRSVSYPLSWYR